MQSLPPEREAAALAALKLLGGGDAHSITSEEGRIELVKSIVAHVAGGGRPVPLDLQLALAQYLGCGNVGRLDDVSERLTEVLRELPRPSLQDKAAASGSTRPWRARLKRPEEVDVLDRDLLGGIDQLERLTQLTGIDTSSLRSQMHDSRRQLVTAAAPWAQLDAAYQLPDLPSADDRADIDELRRNFKNAESTCYGADPRSRLLKPVQQFVEKFARNLSAAEQRQVLVWLPKADPAFRRALLDELLARPLNVQAGASAAASRRSLADQIRGLATAAELSRQPGELMRPAATWYLDGCSALEREDLVEAFSRHDPGNLLRARADLEDWAVDAIATALRQSTPPGPPPAPAPPVRAAGDLTPQTPAHGLDLSAVRAHDAGSEGPYAGPLAALAADPEVAKVFELAIPDRLKTELVKQYARAQQRRASPLRWVFEGVPGTDTAAAAQQLFPALQQLGIAGEGAKLIWQDAKDDLSKLVAKAEQAGDGLVVLKGTRTASGGDISEVVRQLTKRAPQVNLVLITSKSDDDDNAFLATEAAKAFHGNAFTFPPWGRAQISDALDRRLRESVPKREMSDDAKRVFVKRLLAEATATGDHFENAIAFDRVWEDVLDSRDVRLLNGAQTVGEEITLADVIEGVQCAPRQTEAYQRIVDRYRNPSAQRLLDCVERICVSIEKWQKSVSDPTTWDIEPLPNFNLVLISKPGLGKTTFARDLGKLLYETGARRKDVFEEVSPGTLAAGNPGSAAQKGQEAAERARGGTLFVDEADKLTYETGKAAAGPILKAAEDWRGDTTSIATCYPEEVDEFFGIDGGMHSRYAKLFIPDAPTSELVDSGEMFAVERGYTLSDAARTELGRVLQRHRFGSGFAYHRTARNIIEAATQAAPSDLPVDAAGKSVLRAEDIGSAMPPAEVSDEEWARLPQELREEVDRLGKKWERARMRSGDQAAVDFRFKPNWALLGGSVDLAHLSTAAKKLYNYGLLMSPELKLLTAAEFIADYEGQTKGKTRKALNGTWGHLAVLQNAEHLTAAAGVDGSMFGQQAVEQLADELKTDQHARQLFLVFQGRPEPLLDGLKQAGLMGYFTRVQYTPQTGEHQLGLEALFPPDEFEIDHDAAVFLREGLKRIEVEFQPDFAATVERYALRADALSADPSRVRVTLGVVQAALNEQLGAQLYGGTMSPRPAPGAPVQTSTSRRAADAPVWVEASDLAAGDADNAAATGQAHDQPVDADAELSTQRLRQVSDAAARAQLEKLMLKLSGIATTEGSVALLRAVQNQRPASEVRDLLAECGLTEREYLVLLDDAALRKAAGELGDAIEVELAAGLLQSQQSLFWVCSICGNDNPNCPYRVMLEAGDYAGAGGYWKAAKGDAVEVSAS
jgi:hypothetical protein